MDSFDVELSDGRILTVNAPNEQTAHAHGLQWAMANPADAPSAVGDVAKGALSGLTQGAISTAGMSGDARDAVASGVGWLVDKFAPKTLSGQITGETPGQTAKSATDKLLRGTIPLLAGPTSQQVQGAVAPIAPEPYKPQTTAGKYARTIGEFAPGLALPGGAVRRVVGNVLAPAIGSETAGQATEGTAAEPWARLGGAIAGGVAPSVLGRAITPFPANAERTAAVNALRNEGVTDLTAGQVTGRPRLKAMESELGGGRGAELMARQNEQFTAATLRRIGENENRATPEVLDRALTRIGQQFDDVAARNTLAVDRQMANDFAGVQRDYNFLANPMQRQVVGDAINDIIGVIQQNNGIIPGAQYQAMRSRLGAAARGTQDNELRTAFNGLQNALDDAMGRSIGASGNRGDMAAWREARNQYRNFLVIEKAAGAAGENAAMGLISPAALKNATQTVQGRRNYVRGNGDFENLARSGVAVMSPLPNSGTPMRTNAINLGMSPSGAAAGAALGSMINPGLGSAIGAVAGGYTPAVVGRAVVSAPGRAFFGNQVLADFLQNSPPQLQQALLNAVLAKPQSQSLIAAPQGR